MAENVLQVGGVVLFTRKTYQALLVDIYSERVNRCDGYIYAQIPFEAIDEERFGNILLHHTSRLASATWHLIE